MKQCLNITENYKYDMHVFYRVIICMDWHSVHYTAVCLLQESEGSTLRTKRESLKQSASS